MVVHGHRAAALCPKPHTYRYHMHRDTPRGTSEHEHEHLNETHSLTQARTQNLKLSHKQTKTLRNTKKTKNTAQKAIKLDTRMHKNAILHPPTHSRTRAHTAFVFDGFTGNKVCSRRAEGGRQAQGARPGACRSPQDDRGGKAGVARRQTGDRLWAQIATRWIPTQPTQQATRQRNPARPNPTQTNPTQCFQSAMCA